MKKYRIIYALVFALIFALSFAYESRLVPILMVTVLLLPAVTFVLMLISFFMLKISASPSDIIVQKKQDFTINMNVNNRSVIPLTPVRIVGTFTNEKLSFPERQQIIVSLPPMAKMNVEFVNNVKYRGEYTLGIEYAEVFDLLKLFRLRKKINIYTKAVVIPRRIVISPMEATNEDETESSVANFHSFDMTEFSSLREYKYDDNLRYIHWKLSSKQDELIVKQMEQNVNTSALILCDINAYFDDAEKNCIACDAVIEAALAMSREIILEGNCAYMVWFDPRAGSASLNVLENIEDFEKQFLYFAEMPHTPESVDFDEVMKYIEDDSIPSQSVLIITPRTDERLLGKVSSFGFSSDSNVGILSVQIDGENENTDFDNIMGAVSVYPIDPDDIAKSLNKHFGIYKYYQ